MKMEYELRRSARKTLSVEIRADGSVLVRAPKTYPNDKIEAFLKEKQKWIEEKRHLQLKRERAAENIRKFTEMEAQIYRQQARNVFEQKVAYYASRMGVSYGRIAIRDQKTRWGSCSSDGNLNFNWRLIVAPAGVLDYIVVHELAHRKEMNHSRAFWAVVEAEMPDYKKYRDWLKENGRMLKRLTD